MSGTSENSGPMYRQPFGHTVCYQTLPVPSKYITNREKLPCKCFVKCAQDIKKNWHKIQSGAHKSTIFLCNCRDKRTQNAASALPLLLPWQ